MTVFGACRRTQGTKARPQTLSSVVRVYSREPPTMRRTTYQGWLQGMVPRRRTRVGHSRLLAAKRRARFWRPIKGGNCERPDL